VYGPCRGLRNRASLRLTEPGGTPHEDALELVRWKIESMRRAQTEGDVDDGLVLAGQVSGAINHVIRVAEFVPAMADEAARVLGRIGATTTP
jgi:NAD(P)H-dependent flavin oxidoreductase YrpB (nitropropane dioxygenase family)